MKKPASFQLRWFNSVMSEAGPQKAVTRLVMAALAKHMSADGSRCYPSTRTLAIATGLSERAVCTHLELATKAGWIEVRQRSGSGQGWRSNLYLPRLAGAEPRSVPLPPEGAECRSVRSDEKVLNLVHEGAEPGDRKVLKEVQPTRSLPDHDQEREARARAHSHTKGSRFTLETLPAEWLDFARNERPEIDGAREFATFRDYWIAQPGQKGVKVDWFATWRNWIRRTNPSQITTKAGAHPRNGTVQTDRLPWDPDELVALARARGLSCADAGETTAQYRSRLQSEIRQREGHF